MRILVCVKQVPGSSNVEVDPVTGVLKRDGVASKMNPYDLYALELALSMVEKFGGEVETITMGPPQAYDLLHLMHKYDLPAYGTPHSSVSPHSLLRILLLLLEQHRYLIML